MLFTLFMFLLVWYTKTELEVEGMPDFLPQICHTKITTQGNILDSARTTSDSWKATHLGFLLPLQRIYKQTGSDIINLLIEEWL